LRSISSFFKNVRITDFPTILSAAVGISEQQPAGAAGAVTAATAATGGPARPRAAPVPAAPVVR
uniref:hypothetical protein n=1 Tax=Mycobacterium tuberculosis TaxID=1773 RepID=UPI0034CFBD50